MKLLMKIRYDGGAYCGFQKQPNGVSVQEVLTTAGTRLLGFPCAVTGCSRTDSGVHALGFCATLEPRDPAKLAGRWCPIPAAKLHRALNPLLPEDISVMATAEVDDAFHARYNVVGKTYEYRISDAPARDPFLRGRAYHAPRRISEDGLAVMRRCAALFVGKHDFSGYMSVGSKITDPVRHVSDAGVSRGEDGLLLFRVSADGFLYNMVRIMVGTLLDCAYGRKELSDAAAALRLGERARAGFTAPPEGLYLACVRYDRTIDWLSE